MSSLLETINSAPGVEGEYWFRKLHVQPRDTSSRRAGAETVVFLTALDLDTNTFVDKTAAGDIIE